MYEVQLKERIAGYCMSAARSGEMAQIRVSGATSTEDGDLHLKYLEGFPQTVLSMIGQEILPSDVKSMVVLISKDLKARVYINEVIIEGIAIVKTKKVEIGKPITRNDFSGFERIILKGISFPKDHAFFCLLPLGWDNIYVFDYSPLREGEDINVEYDVEKVLGAYFSYLLFKSVHKLSGSVLEKILSQNWFPFYALSFSTVESIINYAKSDWDIDELLEKIEDETLFYIEERMDKWGCDHNILPFCKFLDLAVSRHKDDDFVSSSSIIYPKVEALIRFDFVKDNPGKEGRRQFMLIEHITQKTLNNISTLTTFIPDMFKRYLEECYFKEFSAVTPNNQISRHSVAHGASSIEMYDRKASLLGLLVFSQIVEYLNQSSNTSIYSVASAPTNEE
jgi:hypothetical protein